MQLAPRTVRDHLGRMKRFIRVLGKAPLEISSEDVRGYLANFKEDRAPATYAGMLKSLKVFFRDFLQREMIVKSFRFPTIECQLKRIPSRKQLQEFYQTLESTGDKTLFLLYATTGLRMSEVMSLSLEDVDFRNRMIVPNKKSNRTKRNWISFFNSEAEESLEEHIANLKEGDSLFPSEKTLRRSWSKASEKSGIYVTPQILREWFCSEMGSLGVPDRYVDAFCGRVPKSVLARHYTDFSPEKLKRIYDKAQLKVLS